MESQNRWDQKEEFDEQKGLENIEEVTLIKKSALCVQIRCLKRICCLKEKDYEAFDKRRRPGLKRKDR